jgi:hypothetical protein
MSSVLSRGASVNACANGEYALFVILRDNTEKVVRSPYGDDQEMTDRLAKELGRCPDVLAARAIRLESPTASVVTVQRSLAKEGKSPAGRLPQRPARSFPSKGVPMPEPAVREVIDQYLRYLPQRDERYIYNTVRYLNIFAKDFGTLPADRLRPSHLVRFLACHPTWKSPHTQITAVGTVVTCFRWAWEDRLIPFCLFSRKQARRTRFPGLLGAKVDYLLRVLDQMHKRKKD